MTSIFFRMGRSHQLAVKVISSIHLCFLQCFFENVMSPTQFEQMTCSLDVFFDDHDAGSLGSQHQNQNCKKIFQILEICLETMDWDQ